MHHQISLLSLLCKCTLAAPAFFASGFPFSRIVAFGDDFTDNGQGSYMHNITGDYASGSGTHLWGANTWTDGPVAVTDMANSLGLPITYDYAFGSSQGGAQIGSVCSNGLLDKTHLAGHARLRDGHLVPSAVQQVANYTRGKVYNTDIANTLHFFWTGNNDMIASLGWAGRFTICDQDTLCHAGQQLFITSLMGCFSSTLTTLLRAGAKHIMVPNIYPRHLAPWTNQYITQDPGMVADFGNVINQTNTRLKALTQSLSKKYKAKVLYFDVNGYMLDAMKNSSMVQGAGYNYTCVDGCTNMIPGNVSNWDLFWTQKVVQNGPNPFFWMTTVMPSGTVMSGIGAKMASFLQSAYAIA